MSCVMMLCAILYRWFLSGRVTSSVSWKALATVLFLIIFSNIDPISAQPCDPNNSDGVFQSCTNQSGAQQGALYRKVNRSSETVVDQMIGTMLRQPENPPQPELLSSGQAARTKHDGYQVNGQTDPDHTTESLKIIERSGFIAGNFNL